MKAYSTDFRKKIIETYEEEKISQRELAKRFRVALSFIIKLLKQYRETGKIEAKLHGGGVKLKLNQEQIVKLVEIMEANNDATLRELCKKLEEETGVKVSIATMGRMTQRLKWTVKKNADGEAKG